MQGLGFERALGKAICPVYSPSPVGLWKIRPKSPHREVNCMKALDIVQPEWHEEITRIRAAVAKASKGKNLVIFTSLFSSFESTDPVLPQSGPLWDTFIITDGSARRTSLGVNKISTKFRFLNPRLTAKFFKICAHQIFPQYRYSLYVDSNCILKPKICEFLDRNCREDLTALFFRHNRRSCAYD